MISTHQTKRGRTAEHKIVGRNERWMRTFYGRIFTLLFSAGSRALARGREGKICAIITSTSHSVIGLYDGHLLRSVEQSSLKNCTSNAEVMTEKKSPFIIIKKKHSTLIFTYETVITSVRESNALVSPKWWMMWSEKTNKKHFLESGSQIDCGWLLKAFICIITVTTWKVRLVNLGTWRIHSFDSNIFCGSFGAIIQRLAIQPRKNWNELWRKMGKVLMI